MELNLVRMKQTNTGTKLKRQKLYMEGYPRILEDGKSIKNSLACIITSYYGKNTYSHARSRLSCQLFGIASWTLQFTNTMFIPYGLLILYILREGGSSVLTVSDIMNFWDRLCETLAVRFVILLIYNSLICVFRCMLCCSAVWAVFVNVVQIV
jgi:hypothetical protein